MSHVASAPLVQPADEDFLRQKPLQDRFCCDQPITAIEAIFN